MPPLDTNVIIRYLTNDHPIHSPQACAAFRDLAAGKAAVALTEAVLVETVQVLSSRTLYNLPRDEIRRHIGNIIRFRGVKLSHKRCCLRVLDLYTTLPVLSFVAALLAAYAEDSVERTIISFDQGSDRVPGITRREP
ncbi:MAG: PIN domain-containing protein [Dehalococcoidia bacterium]